MTDKFDKTYETTLRKSLYQEEKNQMSRLAAEFIHERDVIFLDSSTTCLALAEHLINNKFSVTIVTNSMLICSLCASRSSDINLICLGGNLRTRTSSFVGYLTTEILQNYYADAAFISCPKVTLENGLSDNNLNEAKVREMMLKNAHQRFLIIDHTKFDTSANIRFQGLDTLNAIITDQPLSQEWMEYCQSHNITPCF